MGSFNYLTEFLYLHYHIENGFPSTPAEKRSRISRIVAEAWDDQEVIVRDFVKAGIIPVGLRDASGRFHFPAVDSTEAPIVCDEE
ncbi:hypothetical protein L917_02710 [Phytophthora nicotianae]|uniref:DDE-1 domain-containing protein n=1 Tax=Phytophthora nicotianae TaxID=4792 RepID=W2LV72_PHYNI|nr:hypothetical protein L917_02710 [Phytophthora nicotianae]